MVLRAGSAAVAWLIAVCMPVPDQSSRGWGSLFCSQPSGGALIGAFLVVGFASAPLVWPGAVPAPFATALGAAAPVVQGLAGLAVVHAWSHADGSLRSFLDGSGSVLALVAVWLLLDPWVPPGKGVQQASQAVGFALLFAAVLWGGRFVSLRRGDTSGSQPRSRGVGLSWWA